MSLYLIDWQSGAPWGAVEAASPEAALAQARAELARATGSPEGLQISRPLGGGEPVAASPEEASERGYEA